MSQARVVDLLDADSDFSRTADVDAATEDLDNAQLAGIVGLVFETCEPHGRHRPWREVHATAECHPARRWQPALEARLLLANHESVCEALLTDRRTDRSGQVPGLDTGDTQRFAVGRLAPPGMVSGDRQRQQRAADRVGGSGVGSRAPCGEIVRQPHRFIQVVALEVIAKWPHDLTVAVES